MRTASRIETVLTLLVVAALLPAFLAIASMPGGREQRYAELAITVGALPAPVLPQLCERHGAGAEPAVRERLCRQRRGRDGAPTQALPPELLVALQRSRTAFMEPLQRAQRRLAELRLQQREGVGDLLALGQAIDGLAAETRPYAQRYALEVQPQRGPLPLYCAQRLLESAFRSGAETRTAADTARANAVLLLGGALDGITATGALAASALLPAPGPSAAAADCGSSLAEALSDASLLLAQARTAQANASKSEAMRELLRSAGWQWSAWMLLGLGFVKLGRRLASVPAGVALALAVWACAAWVGRVPWPLAGDRVFQAARASGQWLAWPAAHVLAMLGAALLLMLLAWRMPRARGLPAQTPASRLGYPGMALATGIGWVLLLDLSANAHLSNRYLALYHHGHLWLGLLAMSLMVMLRQSLGRGLAWSLAVLDELAGLLGRRLGGPRGRAVLFGVVLAGVLLGSWALSNLRQLTSELGRLWLIVGAAWFFFLRGAPLAERLASAPGAAGSLVRYLWPLLFVVAVLGAAMLATRDYGPLLIAAYGAGAFIAASLAMWWYQRGGTRRMASALAAAVFGLWIAVLTAGLLELGRIEDTTAARLESLSAPLASANDQLALVRWFQRASPDGGFGVGHVPWCGYAAGSGCAGVPAQIHSDYTLTAMVGAFGPYVAAGLTLALALWLHRLVRHHGRVTRGEPRLVARGGSLGNDPQAFLSWLCVAWVVLTLCQLAVTVAGNLAVLPLTGVTYPFVSFGMTSLLVNMAFLGLCLNVDVPAGAPHG